MDLTNIKNILNKFAEDRDWLQFHNPKNLVMALTGEVGELNEIFQWLTPEQSLNLDQETLNHLQDEIADIAVYLLRLSMHYDIDLEQSILHKMRQNELKYPIDKAKGIALKYNKL